MKLDYVYENNNEIITIYELNNENEHLYLKKLVQYYYDIQGERLIEKLIGKGYLSMEEALIKYNVDLFDIKEKSKIKIFKKRKM